MRPVKYVVAVVLKQSPDAREVLIVKRPSNDKELPGVWGLPAVTMETGELPQAAAIRACQEKLACKATPTKFIGAMFQRRPEYDIYLMDIEMVLGKDEAADASKASTKNTKYEDQTWTNDLMKLMPAAKAGSCCSSILLTDNGLLDRKDWITEIW